ncbi:hypothetical protein HPP92_004108 [Vanilla planifolia]|uniref:ZF-HD dimerization-type domain-containing protein n=1 Tax=Vanilla planifolia TaxID=51239 RepID=A0A835S4X0_VANPL|nr:hypothetical protein HPP92_004108 [Vanilla planifolia]
MDLSGHEREIPIPITCSYVGQQSHGHEAFPMALQSPTPLSAAAPPSGRKLKYRECLKNHAASIGGNATDGCGEFMASGEEGTLDAFLCSACSCHRNFHRKEMEGEASSCGYLEFRGGRKLVGQRGVLFSSPHQMILPLGAVQTSESDEPATATAAMAKKRFRTKFTPEQKQKMLCFAEKVEWKLQKVEETAVQQFCHEIGVKRRVLKVWMHNNKHNLARKTSSLQLE